jgi:hypothetical protein
MKAIAGMKVFVVFVLCLFSLGCSERDSSNVPFDHEGAEREFVFVKKQASREMDTPKVIAEIDRVFRYNVVSFFGDGLHKPNPYAETAYYRMPNLDIPFDAQIGNSRYKKLTVITELLNDTKAHTNGIHCLCLPEYGFGIALYGESGASIGWILYAKNHNSLYYVNVNGDFREFRFQRIERTDGLFGQTINTKDIGSVIMTKIVNDE